MAPLPYVEGQSTIEVDGKSHTVSNKDIHEAGLAALQKERDADARFDLATKAANEAQTILRQAQQAIPPAKAEPTEELEPPGPSKEDVERISTAFLYGQPEEVTKAVQDLLGASASSAQKQAKSMQGWSQDAVVGYVQDAVSFNEAMNRLKADPKNGGYSDLWGDPNLRAMMVQRESELRQKEIADHGKPVSTYWDLYKQIGDDTRAWWMKGRDGKSTPASETIAEREKAKRTTGVVSAASARTTTTAKTPVPPTRAQTLTAMAKARGQVDKDDHL